MDVVCKQFIQQQGGSSARVILEDINGVSVEQFLRFIFKTSNKQAKYEALIASLKLAKELGVQKLIIKGDSASHRPSQRRILS